MTQPTIRKAQTTDLSAIEALLKSSELPTAGVKESLSGFLVAESDKQIVGVVGLEHCGGYGVLRSTAVAPEWRGKQVAKRLVEDIIARAEAQGIQSLYLLTTTAERYFPSFGFAVTTRDAVPEPIKATGEFRDGCPATATVMCLPLSV